ncbi:hypothetical protein GCM10027589_02420 [Actinocorallia lasiicapitis]
MIRLLRTVLAAFLLLTSAACTTTVTEPAPAAISPSGFRTISRAALPAEARTTLDLIAQGGPYPYKKDGTVFANRERLLPARPGGYYREFTVPTPGENDRGARRVIAGRDGELFYTPDHYRTYLLITG